MIIAHGKLLADGTPAELEAQSRHNNAVRLALPPQYEAKAADELRDLPDIAAVEPVDDSDGHALMIFPRNGQPIVGIVSDLLRAHRWETLGLRVERGRLDDVFRQITLSH
jgi:ABC-2 type transport system ATP-binding protein